MIHAQQKEEVWQCNQCGHLKFKEEEVMCWSCGKGEMIFQGHRWVAAVVPKLPLWDRLMLKIFGRCVVGFW